MHSAARANIGLAVKRCASLLPIRMNQSGIDFSISEFDELEKLMNMYDLFVDG